MNALAGVGQRLGADWTSGNVAWIERGEAQATLERVTILQLALTELLGRPVALGELLGYDPEYRPDPDTGEVDPDYWGANQPFDLGGGFEVLPSDYLRYLHEDNPQRLIAAARNLETLRDRFIASPQERKLARQLGVSPQRFRELSQGLWATTFEDHRDELAGADATPQAKGRVSRLLLTELEEGIRRGER